MSSETSIALTVTERWLQSVRAIVCCAVTVSVLSTASYSQQLIDSVEQSRVRLHSIKIRFEPLRGLSQGECNALTLDDLRVTLRGEPLLRQSLVELSRERRPAVHALVIDTSGSMIGKLDYVREGAAEYLERLDPELDRSMAVTFDESIVLLRGPSVDHASLAETVQTIRMGLHTSLYDALYYTLRELEGYRERPVVVLLSDGVDAGSTYDRDDVRELSRRRSDLTIFTIGYQLPPLQSGGPAGVISTRRYLQNAARESNGKFFDVPTGSRLSGAFEEIHAILANEALLVVIDPDPDSSEPRARIKVETNHPGCAVKTLRVPGSGTRGQKAADQRVGLEAKDVALNTRLPFDPMPRIQQWYKDARKRPGDPTCDSVGGADPWFARPGPDAIQVCALDITMEKGLLYDLTNVERCVFNDWLELRVRSLEIAVPKLVELPHDPSVALDRLARHLLDEAAADPETETRKRPAAKHARPYHDIPQVCHGRTFLETRGSLARALYAYPDYREWTHSRLELAAGVELERMEKIVGRHAPSQSPAAVRNAVVQSIEGQRALTRASQPGVTDLQNHLAAWLGDISAHDIFERWEIRRMNESLSGIRGDYIRFEQEWSASRRLFFVPSYARVLTLLTPIHDLETDRVGYWRVVLPRPGWLLPRVRGYRNHPEFSDLPVDLVPDKPFGFLVLDRSLTENPELRDRVLDEGYRVVETQLDLLASPYRLDPRRAYLDIQVTVVLRQSGKPGEEGLNEIRLGAHVTLDRASREASVDELTIQQGPVDETLLKEVS